MRKTKIVCTLGPATDDPETMKKLMHAGMNVARINFSHGNYQDQEERINVFKWIRGELRTSNSSFTRYTRPRNKNRKIRKRKSYFKKWPKFQTFKRRCIR